MLKRVFPFFPPFCQGCGAVGWCDVICCTGEDSLDATLLEERRWQMDHVHYTCGTRGQYCAPERIVDDRAGGPRQRCLFGAPDGLSKRLLGQRHAERDFLASRRFYQVCMGDTQNKLLEIYSPKTAMIECLISMKSMKLKWEMTLLARTITL